MTKNAEELGLRKLSKKEATKLATKEVQEEKASRLLLRCQMNLSGEERNSPQYTRRCNEENQRREFWPLRIGSGCPTARQKRVETGLLAKCAMWLSGVHACQNSVL